MTHPIRPLTAPVPMSKPIAPTVERRRHSLGRAVWALLFEKDRETMECFLLLGLVVFALTILVLNARIMATYPPIFQGNALTLPAWTWSGLLLSSAGLWFRSRKNGDLAARLRAIRLGFFVCCGLCGPLSLKAPSFVVPVVVMNVLLAAVGVRILKVIEKVDKSELEDQGL